jgi:hypothetical protein
MHHNGWDRALKVTAGGSGLVGHAGAVLLRKAADQAGLTAGLGAASRKAGASPVFDRASFWSRWRPQSRWGPRA